MNNLISVIVPVYNSEKFLEKCIESILSQTYTNLELILINDGSKDASPKICDEFVKKDNRIKVIHKTNGGVSSARNAGLSNAKGEYICFVDSDDIIPPTSVMDLYKGMQENNCQYAAGICGILKKKKVKNPICSFQLIDFNRDTNVLLKYITQPGSYSPYAKMYSAKIIKENHIMYNENLKCSEDALFIRQYLKYCSCICLIPYVVYEYNTDNENSLSKRGYSDFCIYYEKKLYAIKELMELLSISEAEKQQFISQRAIHGLKISMEHYFYNWKNKDNRLDLFQKAILTFDKWITDVGNLPNGIGIWYRKYKTEIETANIKRLLRKMRVNYFGIFLKRRISKLKKFL